MKTVRALVDGIEKDIVVELDPEEKDDMVLVDDTEDELENTMKIEVIDND
ncbi:MAG: hypothetical protein IKN87_01655 [Bacilli bacterium]|nr:hypothetical protein [Bacilli bacterium]